MVEWGNELLVAHVQTAREADGGVAVDPADLAAPRFVFHMAPFNSVDHLHLYVRGKTTCSPRPQRRLVCWELLGLHCCRPALVYGCNG